MAFCLPPCANKALPLRNAVYFERNAPFVEPFGTDLDGKGRLMQPVAASASLFPVALVKEKNCNVGGSTALNRYIKPFDRNYRRKSHTN